MSDDRCFECGEDHRLSESEAHTSTRLQIPRGISKHQQQAVTSKERMVRDRGLTVNHLNEEQVTNGKTQNMRSMDKSKHVGWWKCTNE